MVSSPTARSLALCRKLGWQAAVVEKWIPQTRRRLDLFGIIDILVLDDEVGVCGIQATSTPNMAARVTKAQQNEILALWLASGNRFEVWGWAKRGAPGTRKLWTLRRLVAKKDGQDFELAGIPCNG